MREQVRGVISSEMILYQNHNLLMYLKAVMITFKVSKAFVKEVEDFSEFKSSDFDDDLLNVEKS